MSRTIRRKSDNGWSRRKEALRIYDWPRFYEGRYYLDPHSEEGKRKLARYHSDAAHNTNKEPGPAWYRHVVVDVPWRLEGRRQLRRYMRDPEFCVVLNGKDPLPYWD